MPGAQSVNLNRLGQAGEKKKKEKKKEKRGKQQQPARKGAQAPTPSLRQLVTSDHSYHTKGSVKTGQTFTRNCLTEREGQPPPRTTHQGPTHPDAPENAKLQSGRVCWSPSHALGLGSLAVFFLPVSDAPR